MRSRIRVCRRRLHLCDCEGKGDSDSYTELADKYAAVIWELCSGLVPYPAAQESSKGSAPQQ